MHISFLCILLPDASLMQYWKENMPDALNSERVRLEGPLHSISSLTLVPDASTDVS
jgi:hypothetical protein